MKILPKKIDASTQNNESGKTPANIRNIASSRPYIYTSLGAEKNLTSLTYFYTYA